MTMNNGISAIYGRISTESQEDGMSLEYQKESCLSFAEKNGLSVNPEYIFLEQYSGAFLDRPLLDKTIELAKNGKIQSIIVLKRDRLARDSYVYHAILKQLSDLNVKIYFSEEKLTGDRAIDSFMGSTLVNFAAYEKDMIRYRTYAGKRTHLKANKWVFSTVPYGYTKNPQTKELEVYDNERDIIQKTVALYLEEGLSLGAIAKKYTQENLPPPSMSDKGGVHQLSNRKLRKNAVNHWSEITVYRIFKKASVYAGEYQAFTKEYKKIGNNSVIIGDRPKEDWITVKIPQIITKKQAEAVTERLEHNRVFSKKRSIRTYMLQGKLFCDCEAIYHNFAGYANKEKELKNYRCSKYNLRKTSIDRHCKNHISGLKIESVVIDTIKELLLHPDYLFEEAIRELTDGNEIVVKKDRYHELYSLVQDLDEKNKRNEDLFIEGNISKERFLEKKKELEERKEDYSNELSKESEIIKNVVGREAALKDLKSINEELQEIIEYFFQYATYEDLKEIVNIIVEKVIVPVDRKNPVRILLKIPFRENFADRYLENEMITAEDDNGTVHNICPTGLMVPRILKLDMIKSPLKYRTVEFGNSDDEDGTRYEDLLLGMLKNFFHQPYRADHKNNKSSSHQRWGFFIFISFVRARAKVGVIRECGVENPRFPPPEP